MRDDDVMMGTHNAARVVCASSLCDIVSQCFCILAWVQPRLCVDSSVRVCACVCVCACV